MATDPDDDALAWAGDEAVVAPRETTAGRVAAQPRRESKRSIPAALLVTYGIIAGVYLLYTAGWIITVVRSVPAESDVFTALMFRIGQGLAIASPAVWFAAVLLLARDRKPLVRLLWLLVGLVVVIPWPTLLGM